MPSMRRPKMAAREAAARRSMEERGSRGVTTQAGKKGAADCNARPDTCPGNRAPFGTGAVIHDAGAPARAPRP